MHEKWEELIPFYVTGTLSPSEVKDIEEHLATCEMCRASLDEWVTIANAVHLYAVDQGKELPALSMQLRQEVSSTLPKPSYGVEVQRVNDDLLPTKLIDFKDVQAQNTSRRLINKNTTLPLTLVAVSAIVLLFVALLVLMLRAPNDPNEVAFLSENDQLTLNVTIVTATPLIVTDDKIPSSQIPFVSTPQRPTPLASEVSGVGGGGDNIPDVSDVTISCSFGNSTNIAIPIHEEPSFDSDIIGQVLSSEVWLITLQSETGWLQIISEDSLMSGWVQPDSGSVFDGCGQIPVATSVSLVPSATPVLSNSGCVIISQQDATVTIYSAPDEYSSIVRIMQTQAVAVVISQLNDLTWYQVEYTDGSTLWYGWVQVQDVRLMNGCDEEAIPLVRFDGFDITLTPTRELSEATPTPTATVLNQSQVVTFTVSPSQITPGQSVLISWETQNTSGVWVEYYNPSNLPTEGGVFNPDRVIRNLASTGSINVFIPESYAFDEVIFGLVINSYDQSGRLSGETISVSVDLEGN